MTAIKIFNELFPGQAGFQLEPQIYAKVRRTLSCLGIFGQQAVAQLPWEHIIVLAIDRILKSPPGQSNCNVDPASFWTDARDSASEFND